MAEAPQNQVHTTISVELQYLGTSKWYALFSNMWIRYSDWRPMRTLNVTVLSNEISCTLNIVTALHLDIIIIRERNSFLISCLELKGLCHGRG